MPFLTPIRPIHDLKTLKNQKGYSLVEFALTLPILFLIVLGSIDIHSSIQAYTAVQEGVRTAVRCSSTTDGDCLENRFSSVTPYYNWVAYVDETPNEYWGREFRYGGDEIFLRGPEFSFSNFRAREITAIDYNTITNTNEKSAARLLFPKEGTQPKIVKKRLPRVRVNRAIGLTPSVQFRHQTHNGRNGGEPGYNFQNATEYGHFIETNNPRMTAGDNNSGSTSVSFTIPRTHGTDCRVSDNFNSTGGHAPSNRECDSKGWWSSRGYDQGDVEVIVYVQGTANVNLSSQEASQGLPDSATGRIQIRVGGQDLGGRTFTSNDGHRDASLCPRGVPSSYLESQSGCNETAAYRKIQVPTGRPISINLSLEKMGGNGTLDWRAQRIAIFHPFIESGWRNWFECNEASPLSEIGAGGTCTTQRGQAIFTRPKNPELHPTNYVEIEQPLIPNGLTDDPITEITPTNCDEIRTSTGLPLTDVQCRDYFDISSREIDIQGTYRKECASNYGQGININGGVTDLALAKAACGAVNPNTVDGTIVPGGETVHSRDVPSISAIAPIAWEPRDCNTTKPIPAQVTRYHNHDYDTTYTGESDPIHLGRDIDPREALLEEPYNCSIEGRRFTDDDAGWDNTTRDEEFFNTIHFKHELGCDDETWQENVRAKAEALGLHSNAFFEAHEETTFNTQTSGGDIYSPITKDIYDQYGESCDYHFNLGQPSEVSDIYQGSCDSPDTPPVNCNGDGVYCVKQFGGFCGDNLELPGQDPVEAIAEEAFFGRVKSTYPQAQPNCEGKFCTGLTLLPGKPSDSTPTLQSVSYEGRINVPLLLGKLLGRESFTFTFQDERTLESELAR